MHLGRGCALILSLVLLASSPSSASALRLYNSGVCPFAQRAWIALLETNVPFEHVLIDLRAKPADFLALSPTGLVPLLQLDDGSVVSESTVVARRVATEFPLGAHGGVDLMPSSAVADIDAFVRHWCDVVEPAYYGVLSAETEAQARFKTAGLLEALAQVEDQLWQRRMLDG